MQQNLIKKIYLDLDMIRIMAKLAIVAIKNDSEKIGEDVLEYIFEDTEKRCWNISENVEKLENLNKN